METISVILSQLEGKLRLLQQRPISKKVVVGFDGFIDSIRKAVRSRDAGGVQHYTTLIEFADRIKNASGRSGQIEMDVQKVKAGGNAPILSAALSNFKIPVTCLGSIDHPVFKTLSNQCKTVSLLPPGESDAIEFSDGKLILSDLSVFEKYDWEYIKRTVGLDKLASMYSDARVIALVDWVNVVHAEKIWEGVLEDIIKPSKRKDYIFFFDLCDPSKKSALEIDDILDLISEFSPYGRVTLGLNENEALSIWSALTNSTKKESVEEAGRFLHYAMNIETLLIHPIDRTLVFTNRDVTTLPGRFVTDPKVQTGGGDNLNAGFILGQLADLSTTESAILGMAASGSFVQEGKSAELTTLIQYINTWKEEVKRTPDKDHETKTMFSLVPLHY